QGIGEIRERLASAAASGNRLWRTYNLAQLAQACEKAGRVDEGLAAIAEALALVQQHGECWWEAEIVRLRSELLLTQAKSNAAEVQSGLELAIQVTHKQSARSLELRATISLARLLMSLGQCNEARAKLAEIYNWFTEGFETADLKEAKALLEELNNS